MIFVALASSLFVITVLAIAYFRIRRDLARKETVLTKLQHHEGDKARFLAHVSHEIRTPLNGIIGLSTLLAQPGLPAAEDRRLKALLSASAQQLLELVNDVLDLSKLEAGKMAVFSEDMILRNWIESVLFPQRTLAHKKGLKVEVQYEGDSRLRVRADAGKLTQVLNNLVGNAIKFTDQGRVQITLRSPTKLPGNLLLRVEDTGIGMSPATQSRLFQSFSQADLTSTRKYGGTGLGLYIVRELVTLLGGKISVNSRLGVGSVFEVELPVEQSVEMPQHAPPQIPAQNKQRSPDRKICCLVVDDNATNRLVLTRFLEKLGCAVETCENGLQAVEVARTKSFDAIFMDCEMPVMDGFAATRAIREQETTEVPCFIIAVTAGVGPEDNKRCLEAGMDLYLPKPFTIDQLRSALLQVDSKARAA